MQTWCVRCGDRDKAKWLIEQGADPEPVGLRWRRDGQSPLQVAIADGRTQMASLLKGLGVRHQTPGIEADPPIADKKMSWNGSTAALMRPRKPRVRPFLCSHWGYDLRTSIPTETAC